jgi:hypothetical protein
VGNARLELPDVKLGTFSGAPDAGENVTLCATPPPPFDHVTVPPTVIVTVDGLNENTADP